MRLMHALTQAGGLPKSRRTPSAWSRYGDPKAEADTKVKHILKIKQISSCRGRANLGFIISKIMLLYQQK